MHLRFLLPAALAAWPGLGWAHAAWLAQSHGALAVIYGHGASDEAYDPARVTRLQACDAAGACADLPRRDLDTHVETDWPEGAHAVAAAFDNGTWSQDAQGEWHNRPRTEVEGATRAGRYLKHATYLLGHLEGEFAPLGHRLEIVPLADPLDMAAGDALELRVLFDGEPVEGASVVADYVGDAEAEPVLTDAEGVARVVLRQNGLNVVAASHTVALEGDPDADEEGHVATLAFTLHSHDD
jgi:nickel transport protein